MPSKYDVLWIDDDEDRRENGRGSVRNTDQINIIALSPEEVAAELLTDSEEESKIPSDPDLALVDWYLQTGEYTGDGPSIEGILRDRRPHTPIYAFSSQYGERTFERDQKVGQSRFATITAPDKLNNENLIDDIQDYERIRSKEGEGFDGIMELLGAPESLSEKVQDTLPQEFSEGLPARAESDSNSSLRFARYVRNEWIEQPGIVWDEIWTSTKVGVDKEKFEEYRPEVSDAKYAGVFSHRYDRWWQVKIQDELYDRAKEHEQSIGRLWEDGPELLDVDAVDRSTCDVSGCEKPHRPQTVAAGGPNEPLEFQVHYKCSNIEQSTASMYEDFRVLMEL